VESLELPLIVWKSRWPTVVSLIGAIVVAVFLFWLPDIYSHRLQFGLAWVFCLIATGCVSLLVERKPVLTVSSEGIHAPHWDVEVIFWDELEDVFVKSSSDGDYLCLSLRQHEAYRATSGRFAKIANTANRETGFGDLTIKPSSVGLDANELLQLVRRQIAESRSEPKPRRSSVKYRAG
jgi:hypothetical protein